MENRGLCHHVCTHLIHMRPRGSPHTLTWLDSFKYRRCTKMGVPARSHCTSCAGSPVGEAWSRDLTQSRGSCRTSLDCGHGDTDSRGLDHSHEVIHLLEPLSTHLRHMFMVLLPSARCTLFVFRSLAPMAAFSNKSSASFPPAPVLACLTISSTLVLSQSTPTYPW